MTHTRKKQKIDYSPRVHWIRSKIRKVGRRKIRVVIYARYSTDEQNPGSITDQVAYCRRFLMALELAEDDFEITVFSDEGISGEKTHRDGILRVLAGIGQKQWDLVLVEDASRLYRNVLATMEFAENVVDNDLRLISINDEVDTADEDYWEDRLYEAARHHAKSNKYTAWRIQRTQESLWAQGAAVGALKSGYRRIATHPATDDEPQSGPFYDEIDPAHAPIVAETYQRIAAKETPWSAARWLTSIGFPKSTNASNPNWTADNVIALIKRLDYRGLQTFRVTVTKKKRRTGEHSHRQNTADKILTRDMPHLRIVDDWLWYQANEAIKARTRTSGTPRGDEHCLAGIPRDSRGPLSNLFFCNCCKRKMHVDGRRDGGYRCSQCRDGRCWNKSSAASKDAHQALSTAIIEQLLSLGERSGRLVEQAGRLLDDGGRRDARRAELQQQEQELVTAIQNLNTALESVQQAPQSTVALIGKREESLDEVRAELASLSLQTSECAPVTEQEIQEAVDRLVAKLEKMDRAVRDDLKELIGVIWAVPYRQFGSDKVILRAKFELNLRALLPTRTRAALAALHGDSTQEAFERVPLVVNLFEPSTGPKHGQVALLLAEEKQLGLSAIGKVLGITKRQANIAVQYGRELRGAGLNELFTELTEAPASASRWRNRREPLASIDRKAS